MSGRGQIRFGSTTITYSVVRSSRRRKTIEITLDPTEGVLVAAPIGVSCVRIEALLAKRAGWIVRHASESALRPQRKQFVSGESLPYLGRQVRLFVENAEARHATVKFDHWSFHVTTPRQLEGDHRRTAIERVVTAWYKTRAAERLAERVARWSALAGCAPAAVLVRSQRERWASCSPDGTLRFNWRIIMAPPALIDYVVVHELVHLRVRNHSPEFWAGVASLMPDYRIRRARLKELGPSLAL